MDYTQVESNKVICHMSERCGTNRHDPGFEAAIYILAALGNTSIIELVGEQRIDFPKIIAAYADYPVGEQALVRLAATLHDPDRYPVTIAEIFTHLDRQQRKTAIWGILVRYPAIAGI